MGFTLQPSAAGDVRSEMVGAPARLTLSTVKALDARMRISERPNVPNDCARSTDPFDKRLCSGPFMLQAASQEPARLSMTGAACAKDFLGTSEFRMLSGAIAQSTRLAVALIFFLLTLPSLAMGSPDNSARQPPDVQEFLRLLGKADVQEWLRGQQSPEVVTDGAKESFAKGSFGQAFSERLTAIRNRLVDLWHVVPQIGSEFRRASQRLREAGGGSGPFSIVLTTCVLAGFGFAGRALARSRFQRGRLFVDQEGETLGSRRRRRFARSIARESVGILAFCFACFGPLLLFERESLPESIVLTFLAAFAAWVSVLGVAYIAFMHDEDPSMRLSANPSPIRSGANQHFLFWIGAATGWFALGTAITAATRLSGMDPLVSDLVSYILGLGLVVMGFAAIWRTPEMHDLPPGSPAGRNESYRWIATFFLIVLGTLWVADAMRLFWLLATGLMTPVMLKGARKLTRHLFLDDQNAQEGTDTSTTLVVVDTLLRASLIGAALWVLAGAWDIGFSQLAATDDPISKIARALLTALAILFVFDVLWQFTRTAIDLKIARVDETASSGPAIGSRQARFRTLLPVARNFAMVVFATLAALMTLSTLGVEIGPLIASAGVVGLAIGFGAQTLVKDVISGIFYLLDDAFRVGEHIVSGTFSGTVESFSLRSVRLRHHNGPIFTVPFSALGAVQNTSRDYAVEKLLITVNYDTDLEKARKLIKRVGQQLMEDPELAPMIIEPLKMQAVSDFGTYGIQLKLKTTTKPGAQSAVRKKAYPLIKKMFDENGIEFAHPTVKVAEGDPTVKAAAAQQMERATVQLTRGNVISGPPPVR